MIRDSGLGTRDSGFGIRDSRSEIRVHGSGRACTYADRSMCGRSELASDARGVRAKNGV